MISIIISSITPEHLERCKKSIEKSIGVPYELLVTVNPGRYSLAKVYNDNLTNAQYPYVVFMHEDTSFKSKNWGKKVISLLEQQEIGLVGVAGTTYLPDTGKWVSPGVPFLKGRIIHESPAMSSDQIELFSSERGDFDVVTVDGVFMATRTDVAKKVTFDEKTFTGFHFYDHDFSLSVAQQYRVVVTTDILVKHYSSGHTGQQWEEQRALFLNKYKHLLPFTKEHKTPNWKSITPWNARLVTYGRKKES